MHIDPFIFAAQIINFLILVYLLKRLLYDRIVNAMNLRETGIARRISEAERLNEEARRSVEDCEGRRRAAAEQSAELLEQARLDALKEKDRLLELARSEVLQAHRQWTESLEQNRLAFLAQLRRQAGTYVLDTVRQVLTDLADEDLEHRMVSIFNRRLASLGPEQRKLLERALEGPEPVVTVKTGFALGERLETSLEESLRSLAGREVALLCETKGHMGAGIEITAHGYKLAWSIDDYLEDLEERFLKILAEETGLPQA